MITGYIVVQIKFLDCRNFPASFQEYKMWQLRVIKYSAIEKAREMGYDVITREDIEVNMSKYKYITVPLHLTVAPRDIPELLESKKILSDKSQPIISSDDILDVMLAIQMGGSVRDGHIVSDQRQKKTAKRTGLKK